jgi:hypothetical protein
MNIEQVFGKLQFRPLCDFGRCLPLRSYAKLLARCANTYIEYSLQQPKAGHVNDDYPDLWPVRNVQQLESSLLK